MSAPSSSSSTLTELEAVVLAYVRSHQPCTPYRVRSCFQESISSRFSGSAGAIYPSMERLQKRGFLRSSAHRQGQRESKHFTLTARGTRALESWLEPPQLAKDLLGQDPLRTRMLFLALLPAADRNRWFEIAERRLGEERAAIVDYARQSVQGRELYFELANDHALRMNRARLQWLRHAHQVLGEAGALRPTPSSRST